MSRVPSIPPAHERTVVDQWLGGASPRQIAKTMRTKHHVPTTHTSVQRLLDRVAAGCHREALAAVTVRLRLQTSEMATHLEDLRNRTLDRVGLRGSGLKVQTAEDLRELTAYDKAERLVARQLKMAGVGGRFAEEVTATLAEGGSRMAASPSLVPLEGPRSAASNPAKPHPIEPPIVPLELARPDRATPTAVAHAPAAKPVPAPDAVAAPVPPGREVQRLIASGALESPQIESYAQVAAGQGGSSPLELRALEARAAIPPAPALAPPDGAAAPADVPVRKEVLPTAEAAQTPVEPRREVQRLTESEAPESQRIESYADVTPERATGQPVEVAACAPSRVELTGPRASAPAAAWGPGVPGWRPGRPPPPPTRAARREAVALEARARDEARALRPAARQAGR